MKIRLVEAKDSEKFVELSKEIDASGYMLFEPGERRTTVEQQNKFFEKIGNEKRWFFMLRKVRGN